MNEEIDSDDDGGITDSRIQGSASNDPSLNSDLPLHTN